MDLFYEDTEVVATHRYIEAIKELVESEREMLTLSGIGGIGSAGVLIDDLGSSNSLIITYEGCEPGEVIDDTTIKPAIDFGGSEKSPQLGGDLLAEHSSEEFPLFLQGLIDGLSYEDKESLSKFSQDLAGDFKDIDLTLFVPTAMGNKNEL